MAAAVTVLGPDGHPVPPKKTASLAGGRSGVPYDAADVIGAHVAGWYPFLSSPDSELNPYRDRIVSRVRDLVRNDGWASSGVTKILDATVGANLRLMAKPDYRALALASNAKFDAVWAKEFARAAEALWRTYGEDLGRYCDASRNLTMSQIFRLAFRHKLIENDALAVLIQAPERMAPGRARYSTAVQVIDPDRLSNPALAFDTARMRGGVEIDDHGAAVAYYIRKAHEGDWFNAAESVTWERIERETWWGRPVVVHDFDQDRAGQHRGGAGIFAPVLGRARMIAKHDTVNLDAAIVNSFYGAYIESPFDHELVADALGASGTVNAYQDARASFHDKRKIHLGDIKLPILFPGEKINAVAANRPSAAYEPFTRALLRNIAAAIGTTYEELTQDWSSTNYSSARAAAITAWKTLRRRVSDFGVGFATPVYGAWLEEAVMRRELPLPAGAPRFLEARTAYARCFWIGPPRGWVDPVKEKQGAVLGMDAGLSTLEQECAEQGLDWEEVLEQRAIEIERFKELDIPLPKWTGAGEPDAAGADALPPKPETVQ